MASQIYEKLANNVYFVKQPNLTYRIGETQASGKISGLEAVKQAILCILSTERYSNPIYSDNYGVELEKYQDKDFNYISSTIENTLREALMQDDRVKDVFVNEVKVNEKESNACDIEFTVITSYGEFEGSVSV